MCGIIFMCSTIWVDRVKKCYLPDLYQRNSSWEQAGCLQVCASQWKTWRETRKRVGTAAGVWCLLARSCWHGQPGTTKRGRWCFFHTGGAVRQRRQEGAGLRTLLNSSLLFISLFSPPALSPAGTHTTKRNQQSATFDKVLHSISVAVSSRYRRVLSVLCIPHPHILLFSQIKPFLTQLALEHMRGGSLCTLITPTWSSLSGCVNDSRQTQVGHAAAQHG